MISKFLLVRVPTNPKMQQGLRDNKQVEERCFIFNTSWNSKLKLIMVE